MLRLRCLVYLFFGTFGQSCKSYLSYIKSWVSGTSIRLKIDAFLIILQSTIYIDILFVYMKIETTPYFEYPGHCMCLNSHPISDKYDHISSPIHILFTLQHFLQIRYSFGFPEICIF